MANYIIVYTIYDMTWTQFISICRLWLLLGITIASR